TAGAAARVRTARTPTADDFGDFLELHLQRSLITQRARDLRKQLAARLEVLSGGAVAAGARDAHGVAHAFAEFDGVSERERHRSARARGLLGGHRHRQRNAERDSNEGPE